MYSRKNKLENQAIHAKVQKIIISLMQPLLICGAQFSIRASSFLLLLLLHPEKVQVFILENESLGFLSSSSPFATSTTTTACCPYFTQKF